MGEYNLKNIRKSFKAKGIFYTPKEIIDKMISLIPKELKYKNVYDPTCGHGDLLKIFSDNIEKYGQDINIDAVNNAKEIPNSNIVLGDTLKEPAFIDKKFDLILANPPFSISWDRERKNFIPDDLEVLPPKSKADYAFILHCLHCLDDNGICIMVCFPGILYRSQAEGKIRQYLVDKNYIDRVIHIDGNKFVDTSINTVILVLKKNKTTTDIVFEDDTTIKNISISQIKDNNYNLSVNTYISHEEEKPEINEKEMNAQIREKTLSNLVKQIELSYMISKEEGDLLIKGIKDITKRHLLGVPSKNIYLFTKRNREYE